MSEIEQAKRLRVELVTPTGPVFIDSAKRIVVPGRAGELGVLPRHIPLTAQLKPGETRVLTMADEWVSYATGSGYFKIQHDVASVLVESAIAAKEIDLDAAKADLEAAQARVGAEGADQRRALRDVEDAENRIAVAGR